MPTKQNVSTKASRKKQPAPTKRGKDVNDLLEGLRAAQFLTRAPLRLRAAVGPFYSAAIQFAFGDALLKDVRAEMPATKRALAEYRELLASGAIRLGRPSQRPRSWTTELTKNWEKTLMLLERPDADASGSQGNLGDSQQVAATSDELENKASHDGLVQGLLLSAGERDEALQNRAPLPVGEAPPNGRPLFAPAHSIVVPPEDDRWLIDDLLARQGVAVIGGDPKLGKSWLASELTVAVASGERCLGEFAVRQTGAVLLCSAEGPPWMATDRLQGICRSRGLVLDDLPIHVMTHRLLRLDLQQDQDALRDAVRMYRPAMLIIDPLTSFHQSDENAVGGLNPILQYLDTLRREFGVAIVLAHHASKKAKGSGGHRLRGTTALHAWVDSGLYLRERDGATILTLEQRTGAGRPPMELALVGEEHDHHLEVRLTDPEQAAPADLKVRILEALPAAGPVTREALRRALGVKNSRLTTPLSELEADGRVQRDPRGGIRIVPVPAPQGDGNGNESPLRNSAP